MKRKKPNPTKRESRLSRISDQNSSQDRALGVGFAIRAGFWAVLVAAALSSRSPLFASAEPTAEQAKFFEQKVRPLLAERCFSCHGDKKQTASLRLDHIASVLEGGESGPSIVPGNPDESLLIEAINYESYEMPPSGKLPENEIAVLTEWVRMGAPWPNAGKAPVRAVKEGELFSAEDRSHWAFQPVRFVEPPEVDSGRWSASPIDRFLFAKMKEAGIEPAPKADRAALIRRAYFDLIGLPPSAEEVEAFVADDSPGAFQRLVDKLLESPRYGERWARHWLDLVRYAESDGFNQDAFRPEIWRYRDYVIQAFNEDKPYDQFVKEQLAGDEIAPHDPQALAATGYLRLYLYEYNQRDARTHWNDILTDVTDATGDVFLGLGMGCARCHDHKFDPILQSDYFRLKAFFTPMIPRDDIPFATPDEIAEYEKSLAAWEEKTADIRAKIDKILKPELDKLENSQIDMFPPDIQEMARKPEGKRSGLERQLAGLALRQARERQESFLRTVRNGKDDKWKEVKELYEELAKFDEIKPAALPTGMTARDVPTDPPATLIDDKPRLGKVEPGFLAILHPEPALIPKRSAAPTSTGRRAALAEWIVRPENPLTTRVIANRVWQYHFGTGLVATASDFGRLGEEPSHPELLDWLTRKFVESGWSFKEMHRLIMNTEAYKLSAFHPEPHVVRSIDPTNRLLWRGEVRRLDAEQIRDAALAISGELQLHLGGQSVPAARPRRSIYTIQKRNTQDPVLGAFDLPGGISSTAARNVTTTPTQALLMINGDWMQQRAEATAKRVLEENSADESVLAAAAYRIAYGVGPDERKLAALRDFLQQQRARIEHSVTKDAEPTVAKIAGGQGALIKEDSSQQYLSVEESASLAFDNFTVEAVIQLDSVFSNASVRTIASQWNGNNKHRGWSLGVTSEKSSYKPRNLIVQLVGDDADGKLTYEVVASNLRLELGRPYYVSAAYSSKKPQIVFTVKDLSDKEAKIQTAAVDCKVTANFQSESPLLFGARDGIAGHRWDGIIDEVRLSAAALEQADLAVSHSGSAPTTDAAVGYWRFEDNPGFYANTIAGGPAISPIDDTRKAPADPVAAAVTDLCHVLLNSNRFLYLD